MQTKLSGTNLSIVLKPKDSGVNLLCLSQSSMQLTKLRWVHQGICIKAMLSKLKQDFSPNATNRWLCCRNRNLTRAGGSARLHSSHSTYGDSATGQLKDEYVRSDN